jgi:hypothetical protein
MTGESGETPDRQSASSFYLGTEILPVGRDVLNMPVTGESGETPDPQSESPFCLGTELLAVSRRMKTG